MNEIIISPSVLACDFGNLANEIISVQKAGAQYIHLDVMDGHFVPNISFGAPVIAPVRRCTDAVFDVHLMISEPLRYIDDFVKDGADIITFHIESDSPTEETIDKIISLGKKASLSVKPKTPIEAVFPYLDKLSMVLVMTVEPGFGGQKFMGDMMPKVKKLREEIERRGLTCDIEVDGGINESTSLISIENGANVLVAGSAVFKAEDKSEIIRKLKHE